MYCQKCGTELAEDARFCRKCGTVVGTQELATTARAPIERRDYEHGIKKFMLGLVFLVIAIFPIFTTGRFWWWMLFPAAPLLAAGIADYLRRRDEGAPQRHAALVSSPAAQSPLPPASLHQELPRARNTAELVQPPPSVTEGTTRLLDKEKASRE